LSVKNEVDKYNEDFEMLRLGYKGVTFTPLKHEFHPMPVSSQASPKNDSHTFLFVINNVS
jgi:hypothetical protein